MPDLLRTQQETADFFRVTTRTVRSWEAAGILQAIRIRGVVRYRQAAIEHVIAGAEVGRPIHEEASPDDH